MSEMVERVARVIYAGAYPRFEFANEAQHIRDHYRSIAHAVLEAMREPTEAMRNAVDADQVIQAVLDDCNKHDLPFESWRLMIDEALK